MVVQAETSAKFANMEWALMPAGCNEVSGNAAAWHAPGKVLGYPPALCRPGPCFRSAAQTRCAAVGAVDRLQFQLSKNAAELMPGPVRFVWRPIRTVVFLDRKSKRRQKKLRLACSVATG